MINADELESFVIDLCKNIDLRKIINAKNTERNNLTLKKELSTLNKNLNENNKLLQGLIKKLALIDDIEILAMIQAEIKNLKSQNETINKRINEINFSMFDIEDESKTEQLILESHELFKKTIDLIDNVEDKRNLITNFIEYFTYDSDTKQIKFKIRL